MPVGAVACRLEPNPDGATSKVYIMTLGVLGEYRHAGIGTDIKAVLALSSRAAGTQLLSHVMKWVEPRKEAISDVYLHVQTSNDVAIDFYKRNGFEVRISDRTVVLTSANADHWQAREVLQADRAPGLLRAAQGDQRCRLRQGAHHPARGPR